MGHGSNLYICQTWLCLRLYCSLITRDVLMPPYKAVLCCNRALQLSNESNKGSSWTGIPGPPTAVAVIQTTNQEENEDLDDQLLAKMGGVINRSIWPCTLQAPHSIHELMDP